MRKASVDSLRAIILVKVRYLGSASRLYTRKCIAPTQQHTARDNCGHPLELPALKRLCYVDARRIMTQAASDCASRLH